MYPINGTETASAKFQKVLFSWATKPEDCFCVLTLADDKKNMQNYPVGKELTCICFTERYLLSDYL